MKALGLLAQALRKVFNPQFTTDGSDDTGNYSPIVVGGVSISGGLATFHNTSSERIYYSGGTKLRLQTDTEFEVRFRIVAKGGVGVILSCLDGATSSNGFYIFVNDIIPTLGFYGVGIGSIFMAATIPIGVFTTVRCIYKRSRNKMLIFVDGTLSATLDVPNFNSVTNTPRDVCVGVLKPSDTTRPLSGDIDYIIIRER